MHGIPESTSTDLSTRDDDNKITVRDIFLKLSTDIPTEFKPIRFGKSISSLSCPIKIILDSFYADSIALTSFRSAKARNLTFFYLPSSFVPKLNLNTNNFEPITWNFNVVL